MDKAENLSLFDKKTFGSSDTPSIEKFIRCTITIPISLSIKLDVELQKNNLTRSAYIREILEKHFIITKEEGTNIETINNKLNEIKILLLNLQKP